MCERESKYVYVCKGGCENVFVLEKKWESVRVRLFQCS